MTNVHVTYGCSPQAQSELAFAADLAHRLEAGLFVWTRRDGAATALLGKRTSQLVIEREHVHVRERVGIAVGLIAPGLKPRFALGDPAQNARDADSVIVGHAGLRPAGAGLLAPFGERALQARGAGEICLPFGNGDSALSAAAPILGLAAGLKLPVLFYHTTWPESGLPAAAPAEAHMIEGARAVRRELERQADAIGVKRRTVVETAATIAQGVCRVALNERCALIAMARGRDVGRGSYVDGVLARTVVPTFVAGRSA